MQHEDILLALGEIAITLAALSGVAGVLAARPEQTQLSAFKILLLRNVALIGMVVTALALLPLTFRGSAFGISSGLRLCSALAACCWLVGQVLFFRRGLEASRSREMPIGQFALGFSLSAAAVILFAWNVLAPSASSTHRYVLGLMFALGIAGINFIVAILRPGPPTA